MLCFWTVECWLAIIQFVFFSGFLSLGLNSSNFYFIWFRWEKQWIFFGIFEQPVFRKNKRISYYYFIFIFCFSCPFRQKQEIFRCFVLILMYLSFVLILEKLYLTTKWELLYLFLMVWCWKKAQKSLISWFKFWHFWCHLKVRFIHFTFKNSVEFTQKIFFQVGQCIHKSTLFLYLCDKKTGECN